MQSSGSQMARPVAAYRARASLRAPRPCAPTRGPPPWLASEARKWPAFTTRCGAGNGSGRESLAFPFSRRTIRIEMVG